MLFVLMKIFVSTDKSLAKYTGDPSLPHDVRTVCELSVNWNWKRKIVISDYFITFSLSFK